MTKSGQSRSRAKRRLYQDTSSDAGAAKKRGHDASLDASERHDRTTNALSTKDETAGRAAVTPQFNSVKASASSFFTPSVKKQKKATKNENPYAARVTPSPAVPNVRRGLAMGKAVRDEKRKTALKKISEQFVPVHVHKNLEYVRSGQAALSEGKRKAHEFVIEHCDIPDNFENDRKFGPLSGTCHEDRVIAAFTVGRLQAKPGVTHANAVAAGVCSFCGEVGHRRISCSALI